MCKRLEICCLEHNPNFSVIKETLMSYATVITNYKYPIISTAMFPSVKVHHKFS